MEFFTVGVGAGAASKMKFVYDMETIQKHRYQAFGVTLAVVAAICTAVYAQRNKIKDDMSGNAADVISGTLADTGLIAQAEQVDGGTSASRLSVCHTYTLSHKICRFI